VDCTTLECTAGSLKNLFAIMSIIFRITGARQQFVTLVLLKETGLLRITIGNISKIEASRLFGIGLKSKCNTGLALLFSSGVIQQTDIG
jgi:hypothetical protein